MAWTTTVGLAHRGGEALTPNSMASNFAASCSSLKVAALLSMAFVLVSSLRFVFVPPSPQKEKRREGKLVLKEMSFHMCATILL